MLTNKFIHYLDGDETKGKKEQELIIQQEEELEQLQEDIHSAKVRVFLVEFERIELFRSFTIAIARIDSFCILAIFVNNKQSKNQTHQNHHQYRNHHHHKNYHRNYYDEWNQRNQHHQQ